MKKFLFALSLLIVFGAHGMEPKALVRSRRTQSFDGNLFKFSGMESTMKSNVEDTIKMGDKRDSLASKREKSFDEKLIDAVRDGDTNKVRGLIVHSNNLKVKSKYCCASHSFPLLHWAASKGFTKMADIVIKNGGKVNACERRRGNTPLHLAAQMGHRETSEMLIAQGAKINRMDYNGNTPLFQALFLGKNGAPLAKMLIEHGADVDICNNVGNTPLHIAALHHNKEIIETVLLADQCRSQYLRNLKSSDYLLYVDMLKEILPEADEKRIKKLLESYPRIFLIQATKNLDEKKRNEIIQAIIDYSIKQANLRCRVKSWGIGTKPCDTAYDCTDDAEIKQLLDPADIKKERLKFISEAIKKEFIQEESVGLSSSSSSLVGKRKLEDF